MTQTRFTFQKIMKLNTLCVGSGFGAPGSSDPFASQMLGLTEDFQFTVVAELEPALARAAADFDIDLVFLEADTDPLSGLTMFLTQLRELRPRLPVVIFSQDAGDKMRYLMRSGATWHFAKNAPELDDLANEINKHVFSPVPWDEIFAYYARDDVKPRIEPGLSHTDLDALQRNPEEQYIIKRLFANSEVVQIFRMDEGFSGSRIYTVKPRHQLKRILKIGSVDDLETVQEKQERLIQPRLFRQVGQIRGKVVGAKHLGGACYSLAGSNQDAVTLAQFLQDPNRVRKELLDKIIGQLRDSLGELYSGSTETEMRYWAPLYARILPPALTLESAVWVGDEDESAEYVVDAAELATLSAVPGNRALQEINTAVRSGSRPEVLLRGFEVAELDTREGVVYLHDTLTERFPADPLLEGKEHPILRFRVQLQPSQRDLLTHPVFRTGKKVAVRGIVADTQESILARGLEEASGEPFDPASDAFQIASAPFLSPLANIRYLLWEVGREDMILPMPNVAPVVHGDLNAGNILVEANPDVSLWLIDFSDARAGHVYFDLAKLEVEFRAHVFYRVFGEMVADHLWDTATATKFLLLIENLLLHYAEASFEEFTAALRDHQTDWYDDLYTQFPLYFENLLYFLFSLRQVARQISPERFQQHYPVAVFFHSIAVLKHANLSEAPWQPWAKRMALTCALVHGKEAVLQARRAKDVAELLGRLRQRSALALVIVGEGENRKYLMQWNPNWERFNLVGGRVNNRKGDRDSFARALQRKLQEELGLKSPKDYRIIKERTPVVQQQFSRREHIFKEYEFRVFEIELLPRHPRNEDELANYAQRMTAEHESVLLSRTEIEHLRTLTGRPISETARIILQEIGEIPPNRGADYSTHLEFHLDELRPLVTRGRAQISGSLVNARFGNMVENILVEVLERPGYVVEAQSALIHIRELDTGYDFPLQIAVQPLEEQAKLTLRVTYFDTRGNEYQQILDQHIQFRTPVFSLFEMDNPYVVGRPISSGSESLFSGRRDLFAWMSSALLSDERPQALMLMGQRKMGKTSVLNQLVNGTLGRGLREMAQRPLFPIYIDLRDLEIRSTGDFFGFLSHIMTRNLRNRGLAVPAPDAWPANGQGYRLFDQYLDEVELALPQNGLLLLVLDEVDQLRVLIEEGVLQHDILPYLHSLMRHRSRVGFVLAGSERLREDFWHLIFQACETWQLEPLNRRDTERLIREPVQPLVHFDDLVVEHIWRATGGHPYLIQLICQRLLQGVNGLDQRYDLIDMTRLSQVIETILGDDDAYLLALWENSSAAGQQALVALAESEQSANGRVPFSCLRDAVGATTVVESQALATTLHVLCRRSLLIRAPAAPRLGDARGVIDARDEQPDTGFQFSFDLFRRWILAKKASSAVPLSALVAR